MYNKDLDTFKIVADSHSFTKASEQLFISHTAVIKQINRLEAHLGVQLFHRSNQGVSLTAAGQCLYAKLPEIIAFSQKIFDTVLDVQSTAPKTIRVGASLFYPCHIFMDLWDSISLRCPQYQLKIVSIKDDGQRFSGLGDAYDFLIGPYNSELRGTDYPFIPIGEYHFCISLPRSHPLTKRNALTFEALRGEPLMMMVSGTSSVNDRIRTEIERDYPEIRLIDTSPSYSIRTFNDAVEKKLPLLSLECWREVHPGLITIPLDEDYTLPYGILTACNTSPQLNEFINILKEALKL
ncbi:MAG: LysR family transcriptional regulator [Eubacterium sp.]|nr:LysR family transcriptional regulator [Eubacterium sp.]